MFSVAKPYAIPFWIIQIVTRYSTIKSWNINTIERNLLCAKSIASTLYKAVMSATFKIGENEGNVVRILLISLSLTKIQTTWIGKMWPLKLRCMYTSFPCCNCPRGSSTAWPLHPGIEIRWINLSNGKVIMSDIPQLFRWCKFSLLWYYMTLYGTWNLRYQPFGVSRISQCLRMLFLWLRYCHHIWIHSPHYRKHDISRHILN